MSEPAFDPAAATSLARSSELLGFGSGARLLIVNSDDFGMYPAVNTAVVESIELGIASSCSLMVPCPAAQQAMRLLGRKPGIDFGTHLTLTCDSDRNRWGPVAARELVPSLLDETGELFTPDQAPQLLGRARLDEVERSSERRSTRWLVLACSRPTWTGTAWPTADAATSST